MKVGGHQVQVMIVPKRPVWANSMLAFNTSNLQCNYPCGHLIKDNTWFLIEKDNGHYFVFHSETCKQMFDRKHKREELKEP